MKKNIIFKVAIFIIVIIQAIFVSCNRVDDNGKLYGQWQLTEWKNKEGVIIGNKDMGLFYNINLELLYLQRKQYLGSDEGFNDEYHCTFSHKGDSLIILEVYVPKANTDSIDAGKAKNLQEHGAGNGRMRIRSLSKDNLCIINSDDDTLCFRKY